MKSSKKVTLNSVRHLQLLMKVNNYFEGKMFTSILFNDLIFIGVSFLTVNQFRLKKKIIHSVSFTIKIH